MNDEEILNIVNQIQPLLNRVYNTNCKVKLHNNIYERLSGIEGMDGEYSPHGEYCWFSEEIYLYTNRMNNVEQVIKTLIHETVHSTQSKELFDYYYDIGYTYDNHPFERQAKYHEKYWKIYEKQLKLCQEK